MGSKQTWIRYSIRLFVTCDGELSGFYLGFEWQLRQAVTLQLGRMSDRKGE